MLVFTVLYYVIVVEQLSIVNANEFFCTYGHFIDMAHSRRQNILINV